jgi:hypothetical protein
MFFVLKWGLRIFVLKWGLRDCEDLYGCAGRPQLLFVGPWMFGDNGFACRLLGFGAWLSRGGVK